MSIPALRGPGLVIAIAALTLASAGGRSAGAEPVAFPSLDRMKEATRLLVEGGPGLSPRNMKDVQLDRLLRKAAPSQLRVLVVGCDFSDSLMWGRDRSAFVGWPEGRRIAQRIPGTDIPMFTAHDSTYFDLQMSRVNEYFRSVSFDRFRLQWDVYGSIVNLPRPMGWYGDPDSSDVRTVAMAQEVIDAVDAEIDFGAYDTLVLIHAGAGSETDILGDSPQQIPSNYLDRRDFSRASEAGLLAQPQLLSGEGPVEHVLILPEAESQDPFPEAGLSGFFDVLGVYCFEFGLRLGMLSLTDFTPEGRPDSQGIGNFGLMGFGLFTGLSIVPSAPSAINRYLMGWVDAVEVRADADLRLRAMGPTVADGDTLLIKVPINDREYWLLEYRLQDPNGDLFYTFADSNGDRVPDYWDADSSLGNGRPTSSYDPATDWWESTLNSEWDYFMSENPARSDDRCMRAGGSGVYIYHIDERVIENSILSGVNTINADPDHKGVDVEEADGIQDLDSSRPSEYLLGWDGDAWRGEGSTDFGPDTLPATDTASGLPTGIRFSRFSTVTVDTLPRDDQGNCTGFSYRPAMTFRVEFLGSSGGQSLAHRLSFRGIAPLSAARVVDLGSGPSDPSPDGLLEIVALADSGRVLAFDRALGDWTDGDGDPTTIGVLAVVNGPSRVARWIGDPAVVDFDGDGDLEVLAAATTGIIALSFDGSELIDGDRNPATRGVMWTSAQWAPVSAPAILDDPDRSCMQVVSDGSRIAALRLKWVSGVVEATLSSAVSGRLRGQPALVEEPEPRIVVPWSDEEGPGFLFFPTGSTEGISRMRTDRAPADLPVVTWKEAPVGPVVLWTDSLGTSHRTEIPPKNAGSLGSVADVAWEDRRGDEVPGAPSILVGAAPRAAATDVVWARAAGGELHALDASLRLRSGFPMSPLRSTPVAVTDSLVAPPAMVDLDGDGRIELIWHEGEGALHAVDLEGRELVGWPIAGPAEPLGGPILADLDGDLLLEMVLMGRFESLEAVDSPGRGFASQARGEVRIYDLGTRADSYAPVRLGAVGLRNQGIVRAGPVRAPAGSAALDEASVALQPNPAVGSTLRVRVVAGRSGPVRAILYNLEGQEVAASAAVFTESASAFDESIDISGLRSGLYVCRIVSGSESILRSFAVAR